MNKIRMRYQKYFIILLMIVPAIFSCSVQKRYHRKGYTIIWKKNDRVKVNHQRKNSIIESTTSNKKNVLAQRYSVQMSFEKSEALSNEPEYLVTGHEVMSNKEERDSKAKTNSHQKLKSPLLLKARKINFNAEISQKTANQELPKSISDKKDFESAGRMLGIAGIFLIIGLIIAGIGLLGASEALSVGADVFFLLAGLFLFLFLFVGLLTILTFGML